MDHSTRKFINSHLDTMEEDLKNYSSVIDLASCYVNGIRFRLKFVLDVYFDLTSSSRFIIEMIDNYVIKDVSETNRLEVAIKYYKAFINEELNK